MAVWSYLVAVTAKTPQRLSPQVWGRREDSISSIQAGNTYEQQIRYWTWNIIFSYSCGIPDTRKEILYLSGHHYKNSPEQKVAKYGTKGFLADLPQLNTRRHSHACAGFYNEEDNFLLLVAGGHNDYHGEAIFKSAHSLQCECWTFEYIGQLSSTEIFVVGVSSEWKEVSPLPENISGARAVAINNKIYLLGMIIL